MSQSQKDKYFMTPLLFKKNLKSKKIEENVEWELPEAGGRVKCELLLNRSYVSVIQDE